MTQSTTSTAPVEKQEPVLTEDGIKTKIKYMIVDLLNTGIRSGVYTIGMVSSAHTFEQLNMTVYEKRRLIFQCDEYYGINLGAAAEGTSRVGELISMVIAELQQSGKLPKQEEQAAKTEKG